LQAHW